MAKAKGREKYKLVSTGLLPNGKRSKYFYTITRRKGAEKIEKIMKYDPWIRKHVAFKQEKLK